MMIIQVSLKMMKMERRGVLLLGKNELCQNTEAVTIRASREIKR